jgi:hypothetical protein
MARQNILAYFAESMLNKNKARGCIFSHVRPFYERAVSDLDQ